MQYPLLTIVKNIHDYRLPSIQRPYVWAEDRIYSLMDSIMNEYPIGYFLIWKPNVEEFGRLRIRPFRKHVNENERLDSSILAEEFTGREAPFLVLDGQQRLQTITLALHGTFNNRSLYFKVDSGTNKNEEEFRYRFKFFDRNDKKEPVWVNMSEIIELGFANLHPFVARRFENLDENTRQTIVQNLGVLYQVFVFQSFDKFLTVPGDRKYEDVLEIFTRVNSGGVVLSKSDLVFSTMMLKGSDTLENQLYDLRDNLNGREYDFDLDFLIKLTFVLFDRGARFNPDKLKDENFMMDLNANWSVMHESVQALRDFLQNRARIFTGRFLKSKVPCMLILDFIFRQEHQRIPEGEITPILQFLYLSLLGSWFSYGGDSKLDAFHNIVKHSGKKFPLEAMMAHINESLTLQKSYLESVDLILNILEGGLHDAGQSRWAAERDHIFPRGLLKEINVQPDLVNDIGNLRFLDKISNAVKSDELPGDDIEFFGREDKRTFELFKAARDNLTAQNYHKFVTKRASLIEKKVKTFLRL